MSLETFFDVSPNCLLAFPMAFVTDFTSNSGLPSERGSGIPSTLGRARLLRISPPTTPAAAAPTASAGPPALLPALLSVLTTPLLSRVLALLRLDVARRELDAGLARLCGPRLAPSPLVAPLRDRDALLRLRVEAADLGRADEPERGEPFFDVRAPEREDPLACAFERAAVEPDLVLEPEPLDEALFV